MLVLVGAAGLLAELLLLDHFEAFWQWLPLVLLAAVLPAGVVLWRRPGRNSVRVFQGLMVLCIAASLAGLVLHLRGNTEFELEMDGGITGYLLAWRALRGATPALAPGAMAQLGVLGLILTYRHPAVRTDAILPRATSPSHPRG